MSETLLANTSTEGLAPLGSPPQRSFELISGTVRADCGERHAALFAEPVSTQYGDRFDWYATVDGKARPLAALDEAQRAEAEALLESLLADIRKKAEDYLDSKNPDDQRLGEALSNALVYPGPGSVYVIGSGETLQPVLVHWAWSQDTQATVTGGLSGVSRTKQAAPAVVPAAAVGAAAAVAAVAAPVAPPPPRRPANWWWLVWLGWILLAILIGWILVLMIAPCALRLPGLPTFCPEPGAVASDAERRSEVLRDRIAALERRIAIADRSCQPEAAAFEPVLPPVPEAAPVDEIDERLREAGAQQGDLTFSLLWSGPDDLDLHVTCPGRQTVNFRTRKICNGTLDVDGNARQTVAKPVENIFYTGPASGAYEVRVHLYKSRSGGGTTPFKLRIVDHGQVQTLDAFVSSSERSWTYTHRTGGQ